ncbi:MAG: phage holin family protein [Tannerellaceae bacterium]|nr:phage holin family protein [Tannerellaceae bacterium]
MELTEFLKRIFPQIVMLAIMYFLVLVAVFLDLWAGVRKAKIRGKFRSSFGFRKTVEKIGKYYNMIFVITVIDAMQMIAISQVSQQTGIHLPLIPILTFIGSIFVGFIELKSVYEKAEDKEKAEIAQTAKIVGKVIADISTQELASKVAVYLKNNQTNEHEHENKH